MSGRRWARRSCRTGGGGVVVKRTVAAPATGDSTARRRTEESVPEPAYTPQDLHYSNNHQKGFASSDFRCGAESSTEDRSLPCDVEKFKHKSFPRNSIRRVTGVPMNVPGIAKPLPSVMAELHDFDGASGVLMGSMSWSRPNKISTSKESSRVINNVSGLSTQPRYRLINRGKGVKNPPTAKSCSSMSDFRHQLVRSVERPASTKMSSASANSSLSQKMSSLRQPQIGGNYQSRNRIIALNRRHKSVNSKGEINLISKKQFHEHPEFSLGRHSNASFDNALVRQNQLCSSEPVNHKTIGRLWTSTCSSASCDSNSTDDFQVSSSSSDTSDSSNLSSMGVRAKDQWKMTFKKVDCPLAANLDSTFVIYRKEIGQASPISVLELLAEDCSDSENVKREPADPYDLQLRLELVKFPPLETTTDVSSIGGTSDLLSFETESTNDKPIKLVEDISEEFEDEEEREFSYLLDILIASGIHSTSEDQLYKVCQSLDRPLGYDVFEKLENKYTRDFQWSRSDRKLLFDTANTILSEILAPCLNTQPWVTTDRNLGPLWGSEGLLEKVLQLLTQRREELAVCKLEPEKKEFDQKWSDLAGYIDRVGRDVEKMIKDDLLEELFQELLFS